MIAKYPKANIATAPGRQMLRDREGETVIEVEKRKERKKGKIRDRGGEHRQGRRREREGMKEGVRHRQRTHK